MDELLAVAEETGESDAAMSEDDDDEPEETEEPAKNAETRQAYIGRKFGSLSWI